MSDDLYAILGVAPSASDAEIERVYRRLARAYHPDLLQQVAPAERIGAEERLKAVNRAHRVLGDHERRMAYDRARRRGAGATTMTNQGVRSARAGVPQPVAARTSYQAGGGPIDIEWASAPPVVARPVPDLFTVGRLLRYALAIIFFAVLLALFWHPNVTPHDAPVPTSGIVTIVR